MEEKLRQKLGEMMYQLKRIKLFAEPLLNKDQELVDAMLSDYDEGSVLSSISSSEFEAMRIK